MRLTSLITSAEPLEPAWSWRRERPYLAAIFVIVLAVFANALANGFVYDDVEIIRDNPLLTAELDVAAIFGSSYWGESGRGTALYRPLTILSFAIDRRVFGTGPFGVHLMNVLANGAIAVLVYALVLRLVRRRNVALLTALIFALHPVHVEVVANGVGRSELYAALAMLGAMHLHLTWLERREAARAGRPQGLPAVPLGGAIGLFFVGLLFKESAVVLPALLVLLDWLVVERGRLRPLMGRVGPYLAYGLPFFAYMGIRHAVIGDATPEIQDVMIGATAAERILYAGGTLLRYGGQLVVPWHLSAEYMDYTNLVRDAARDPVAIAAAGLAPFLLALVI